MTDDPVRLLSRKDDAFAASLLESARDGDAEAARRHKAAVLGAAGGAAVGGAALAIAKLSSRSTWSIFGGKWLAAGALVLTGGVGAGALLLSQGPEPAPGPGAHRVSTVSAVPPAAEASPAPAGDPPLAVLSAAPPHEAPEGPSPPSGASQPAKATSALALPSAPAAGPAPPPSAAPAASPSAAPSLSDEVAALRGAHDALGRGQPAKCLEAVDAYFARFPSGRLSAEAQFLRVQALAASGQEAQAAALARSMLARSPRSPYAARLRSIAGEDAAPRNP